MELYLVEYNNKIIGAYKDFNMANIFVKSCLQSGLMNDKGQIHTYTENTCFRTRTNIITINNNTVDVQKQEIRDVNYRYEVSNKSPEIKTDINPENKDEIKTNTNPENKDEIKTNTNPENKDENKSKHTNSALLTEQEQKQKYKIQHKLNLLKKHKEKINESKKIYDADLKLYNIFKSKDVDEIPEIFIKKFNLFKKLEDENNLSWETFVDGFKNEPFYNEHYSLQIYDDYLNETSSESSESNSESNEEFEIDSDIETDSEYGTSDNDDD